MNYLVKTLFSGQNKDEWFSTSSEELCLNYSFDLSSYPSTLEGDKM